MHRKQGQKAGLRLEALVSEELERLNVQHRRTEHMGEEDVHGKVDFVVESPQFSGLPTFEIQMTLQRGVRRKMRAFVLAALTAPERGVRVYLEVWASKWNKVRDIARRVAHAIRDITRFRRFDEHKLLGVRLRAGRSVRGQKLETFSLMHLVGDWVREKLEERRLIAQEKARKEAEERLRKQRLRSLFPAPSREPPKPLDIPIQRRWFTPRQRPAMYRPIRQPR